MSENDTIIVVGVTRIDGYGNLWVTPAGGGDEVKIGAKRKQLHDLFQQGKAVMCHWETYMNKPYVSDAKLVEGELPPPSKAELTAEQEETIRQAISKPDPQAVGMVTKEIGNHIIAGTLSKIFGEEIACNLVIWYRSQILGVSRISYDGSKLPRFIPKKKEE